MLVNVDEAENETRKAIEVEEAAVNCGYSLRGVQLYIFE